jgi:hypothetical protein
MVSALAASSRRRVSTCCVGWPSASSSQCLDEYVYGEFKRDLLEQFLTDQALSLVWTVLGGKHYLQRDHDEWKGEVLVSETYRLTPNGVEGKVTVSSFWKTCSFHFSSRITEVPLRAFPVLMPRGKVGADFNECIDCCRSDSCQFWKVA